MDVAQLKVLLSAESQAFDSAMDKAEARLKDFGKDTKKVRVEVEVAGAIQEVTELGRAMRAITNKTINVTVNTQGAISQIMALGNAVQAAQSGGGSRGGYRTPYDPAARITKELRAGAASPWSPEISEIKKAQAEVKRIEGEVQAEAKRALDLQKERDRQMAEGAKNAAREQEAIRKGELSSLQAGIRQRAEIEEQANRTALSRQQSFGANWAKAEEDRLRRAGTLRDRFGQLVKAGPSFEDRIDNLQRRGYYQMAAGAAVTAATTAPVVAGTTLGIKAAIDFETAFTGVRKTVEGTSQELERIQRQLRDMAAGDKAIPVAFEELSKIAENAGQLGIATPAVAKFTRTMADLGQTTNLSSDKAADELARLANITGMSHENFDRLGSTLVDLGNKFAGTESEIASMSLRIAGAGEQVGMTEAQIMAFATALTSVGIRAEMGGTAISRVFVEMDKAVRAGGESLDSFAKTAGMSSGRFKQMFEKDAAGATVAFITGLKRISGEGGNATAVIEELFGKQSRLRDTLLRASSAGDLFTRALETGNKAWRENTALAAEAEKRYGTTASRLQIFQNRVKETAASLADDLLPILNQVVDTAGTDLPRALDVGAKAWADLPPSIKAVTAGLGAFLLLAGPVQVMAGNLKLLAAGLAAMSGIGSTGGALSFAAANPLVSAAVIAAAVVGGKALVETFQDISTAQQAVAESGKQASDTISNLLDVLPSDDARRKRLEQLRAAIDAAKGDVTKLDKVLGDVTAMEREIKLSAQSDVKTVMEHTLAELRASLKTQKFQIQAEVLVDPTWQTFMTKIGRQLGIYDQNTKAVPISQSDAAAGLRSIGDGLNTARGYIDLSAGINAEKQKRKDDQAKLVETLFGKQAKVDLSLGSGKSTPKTPSVLSRLGLGALEGTGTVQDPVAAARARLKAQQDAKANTHPARPPIVPDAPGSDPKAKAAALKLEKDQLADTAKHWELYAKSVEESTRRQIEAVTQMRDSMRGVFDGLKSKLQELGVINDPLQPVIARLEKVLNLSGQARTLASGAIGKIEGANARAGAARSEHERLSGLDGAVPSYGGGALESSPLGAKIAAEAVRIQAKYGDAIGRVFYRQCDRLADTTVRNVTSKYDRFMGPGRGKMSAAQTMGNFQRAGIGFKPNGSYAPGDIVYSGSRYGGGAGHVMIVGPNGEFIDQYGRNRKPKTRPEWVVRSGGTSPVALQAMADKTGKPQVSISDYKKELNYELTKALGFSGSLSTQGGLPSSWGMGVKNTDGNSARFAIQNYLQSEQGQKLFAQGSANFDRLKKNGPPDIKKALAQYKTFGEYIRAIANNLDITSNRLIALDKSITSIREINKAVAMRGKENDPMAVLGYDFAHDRAATPDAQKQAEIMALRSKLIGDMTHETDLFVKSQQEQAAVLAAGVPFLKADTQSLAQYARAIDLANIKLQLQNDLRDRLESADASVRTAAQFVLAKRFGEESKTYDEGKRRSATVEVLASVAALKERAATLVMERGLVQQGVQSEQEIADAVEVHTQRVETYNKLVGAGVPAILALALANTQAAGSLGIKQYTQATDKLKEYSALVRETSRAVALAAKEQEIYGSTRSYSPDLEKRLAMAREESRLRGDSNKKYSESEIQSRMQQFSKSFDATAKTGVIQKFNELMGDAAERMAVAGDETGMASLQFRLLQGDLSANLTPLEKLLLLLSQAAARAKEMRAASLKNTQGQLWGAQESLEARRLEAAGQLSELAKQELAWKYEDLARAKENNAATAEELALREQIRDVLRQSAQINFESMTRQQKLRAELFSYAPGRARDLAAKRQELSEMVRKGELDQSAVDALLQEENKLLDMEKIDRKRQEVMQRWRDDAGELKGIFSDAIGEGFEGGALAGARSLLSQINNMMMERGKDMIATSLTNKLFGKDSEGENAVTGAKPFRIGKQPNPYGDAMGLLSGFVPSARSNPTVGPFGALGAGIAAATGNSAASAGAGMTMQVQSVTINANSATVNAPLAPGGMPSTMGAPTQSQQLFGMATGITGLLGRNGVL